MSERECSLPRPISRVFDRHWIVPVTLALIALSILVSCGYLYFTEL